MNGPQQLSSAMLIFTRRHQACEERLHVRGSLLEATFVMAGSAKMCRRACRSSCSSRASTRYSVPPAASKPALRPQVSAGASLWKSAQSGHISGMVLELTRPQEQLHGCQNALSMANAWQDASRGLSKEGNLR